MRDAGLLILRLGLSFSMLPHGWSKLNKIINGNWSFSDPIGIGEAPSLFLAVFSEFICAVLILVGYKTKLASVPLAFTMLVAAFITHFDDPWGKKELPVVYMVGFIALALMGGGKFSLEKRI